MRKIAVMSLINISFLVSSCLCFGGNEAVEGFLDHYRWSALDDDRYIYIINEKSTSYDLNNNSLIFINNEKRPDALAMLVTLAGYSPYSWTQYPIKTKLYADKDKNIKRISFTYRLLKGFISDFNGDKKTVGIQKKSLPPKIEPIDDMDFLGPSDLPPNMDAWKKFSKNELEFGISADTPVRCNHRTIEAADIGKHIGREIHVMLDEKDRPIVFNIYRYDEMVVFDGAACTGYILFWENNFSRVRIWEFASSITETERLELSRGDKKELLRSIRENKMAGYGIMKADFKFSKDVRFFRTGDELTIASHYYPLKEHIKVNACFFYGPVYISYNKQGEVETVFVPYEYAE